jgi:hypothetical protein
MGRVHRALGYGFRHCKFKKDPRFNSWVFDSDHELHEMYLRETDLCASEEFKIQLKCSPQDKSSMSVSDFIKHSAFDQEVGCGPLIFTNPFMDDWYQYDNAIDYYSMQADEEKNLSNSVKMIRRGIYPYNQAYINRKTGKRIQRPVYGDNSLDDLSEEMNINKIDIVPMIPEIIVDFCTFLKVFKNPLTVYRLKPMLFTWWD